MDSFSSPPPPGSGERWRFLRDVMACAGDKFRLKIGSLPTEQGEKVEGKIKI
jgi:hypothetical protein